MQTTRRQFLAAGVGAAALPLLSRLTWARALASSPRGDRVLVLVELGGGNDGLNTVVPFAHDRYHVLRPTLRLEERDLLTLDHEVGLRMELKGLKELLDRGQLSILHGVGYPGPDRSHFRSTDIWQTASLEPEKTPTGWIGRLSGLEPFASAARTPALMIGQDKVPLLLVGEKGPAPQIDSLDRFSIDAGPADANAGARIAAVKSLASGNAANPVSSAQPSSLDFLRDATRTTHASAEPLQRAAARRTSRVDYPQSELARELKLAAQLIGGEFACNVFYVRQAGYDTHAFQAASHTLLLRELGDALAAFVRDLDEQHATQRVVVLVYSEFGRRAAENGSRGTDHGAAAPVFLLGGAIKGGLVGRHPSLDDLDDSDPRVGDVRFAVDFRRIYSTLLEEWFELPAERVLGQRFERMPLFARAV